MVEHFGRLDILGNNAGVTVAAPIDSEFADAAAFDRQLAINYTSVVASIRAAFPVLPDGEGRHPRDRPRLPRVGRRRQYEPTACSCDQAAHGEP